MESMTNADAKIPHIALVSSTLDLTFLKNAFETSGLNARLSIYPEHGFETADVAVS
jgi:glyoxylate/hydroxypyruvate reductase A